MYTTDNYLVTRQNLHMYDIIVMEGLVYQVTGFGGGEDTYLLDNIDWDDNIDPDTGAFLQEPIELDRSMVKEFVIEI